MPRHSVANDVIIGRKARGHLLRLCCLSGLLGSVLFLSGEMLFCATWSSGPAFHAYHEMAQHTTTRLVIGGAIGPLAALFSALGMGNFYLTPESSDHKLARTVTALLAIMMLIGGTYHGVFTCFGFASKVEDQTVREILLTQIASLQDTISYTMYAVGVAATALAHLPILRRRTRFPRWLLIFLPTTLSLASSAFRPGGWINGSFALFFAIATRVFWRFERPVTDVVDP